MITFTDYAICFRQVGICNEKVPIHGGASTMVSIFPLACKGSSDDLCCPLLDP